MKQDAFDVVVVGGGPTGLLLASELVLGGARPLLIERRAEPDATPKAGGVGAVAAEALMRRGLGAALDAEEATAIEEVKAMRRSMGAPEGPPPGKPRMGGHFAGLSLIDQSVQRDPTRRLRMVPQQALERVLSAHAGALGVEVWRGSSVESFEDVGDRVRLKVRRPDGEQTLEAAFLVGCDGGRSLVRKGLGIDFPGTDPTLTGYSAVVEIDHPERLLPVGWRRTRAGMMSYGWAPGRLAMLSFDGPPKDRHAPLTKEEVEHGLRHISGADVRVTSMSVATRFTDNARLASTYRKGRAFLAGDAAHVHSPFGGQGLNLGLVDAANLGWKLCAAVKGWAPEGLLDTYTAERHPVAESVLENTRAQLAIMRPDPQGSAMRQVVAELLTASPEANRYFGEMISGVATRYDLGDDDPSVGRLVADGDLTVDGAATRLFALMKDGRALLVDGEGDGKAADEAAPWASRVRIVKAAGARSMLVRPDGCIAWAGRAGGLRPALERWFSAA